MRSGVAKRLADTRAPPAARLGGVLKRGAPLDASPLDAATEAATRIERRPLD